MDKKKLMIVIWNMGLGGIQKRVRDILVDINNNYPEWEVYLVLRRGKPTGFLDDLTKTNTRIRIYSYQKKSIIPLGFIFWLFWQYIIIKPNVTLTFLVQLSIVLTTIRKLAFWIKTRFVINEGSCTSKYLSINRMEYLKTLVRPCYSQADLIIVPTEAGKLDLVTKLKIPDKLISVIPNWTLLSPTKNIGKKDIDILYVGRFENEKNPLWMIKLTQLLKKNHPNIQGVLLGNGSLENKIKLNITTLNLNDNIRIANFTLDTAGFFRRTKILVLPSLNEGMPNVVLEGAMYGVPSVINNFPGSAEVVINGKTGFIAENVSQMANQISQLLSQTKNRQIMGKNATDYVLAHHHLKIQQLFIGKLLNQ